MIAEHEFPTASQLILYALEDLTRGLDSERLFWLYSYTGLEHLQKESGMPIGQPNDFGIWVQYQALVFGFYYKLLQPLVSLEYIQ